MDAISQAMTSKVSGGETDVDAFDGVRGALALWVAVGHFFYFSAWRNNLNNTFAMPFFFVLSGCAAIPSMSVAMERPAGGRPRPAQTEYDDDVGAMVLVQVCACGGIRPPPLGKDNMGWAHTALTHRGDAATFEYQAVPLEAPGKTGARLLAH